MSGATLKGTGVVGNTSVNGGGTVSVGNSPGCMTFSSLTLTSGSTWQQEIAGSTACSGYDQANVTGAVVLGSATLNLSPKFTPADNAVFTIINAASVSGTFNGLANGATITAGGIQFRVNYTATAVTLTKLSGTLASTGSNNPLTATSFGFLLSGLAIALNLVYRRKTARSLARN